MGLLLVELVVVVLYCVVVVGDGFGDIVVGNGVDVVVWG